MSAFQDLTAANAAMKEYYDEQKVQILVYKKSPTMAMVPKDTKAGGKYIPVPVVWEVNQGRSATFANAQGNQTSSSIAEFMITRRRDYDIATIDNETLEASETDQGGFLRQSTLLTDNAIRGASLSASSSLFRSGTGTIGTIATGGITSGVITLSNPADVVQFGVNQTLQANQNDGGTPRAALGYVIARSIKAGTITVSATALGGSAGSPTDWTAGDSLLVQGDNNAKFSGFQAWLPTTDPTGSDNFYGVNRSVDSRLYGINYDGSAYAIEEAVIDHSLLIARDGGTTDHFISGFGSYGALLKALGAKKEYVTLEGPAGISFKGVVIHGAESEIRCFPDRNCPPLRGFMLQMDTWCLYSLGEVPKIFRYGVEKDMLRVYNADAAELRAGYYANLGCNAPGWNGQNILGA